MFARILTLFSCCICLVSSGCRPQEKNSCESICQKNSLSKMTCEIRGAIILPDLSTVEASLPRVSAVIDMAEKRIHELQILPEYINISWTSYDDKCDAALATISVIDAYAKKCVHFVVGPSCEYSVSSVSRIAKYFYSEGLNVVTAGGFSFDFEGKKDDCSSQFFQLHRVGILSFEQISIFMTKLMNKFDWTKAAFFYERNGYFRAGGIQTCHLLMSSMAKSFRESDLTYSPFAMDLFNKSSVIDDLKREIGNENGTHEMFSN